MPRLHRRAAASSAAAWEVKMPTTVCMHYPLSSLPLVHCQGDSGWSLRALLQWGEAAQATTAGDRQSQDDVRPAGVTARSSNFHATLLGTCGPRAAVLSHGQR